MLARAELQAFDQLTSGDTHSLNSLINSYLKVGQPNKALNVYQKMQDDDALHPTKVGFVVLLKACTLLQDLERGQNLLCEIARVGLLQKDVFVGSAAVNLYAKCGCPLKAQEIFDILSCRNVVTWNSLITGYVEHRCGKEALDCYEQMQHQGISPSDVSLVCILKACTILGSSFKGQEIHAQIIKKGLLGEIIIGSALVDMYAKCGFLIEAQQVFDKLPVRDTILWNAMIAGYVEQGHAPEALACFKQMLGEGAFPDSVTVVCILKACCSLGDIIKGNEVHADSVKKGFMEGDAFVGSTLVDLYVKCGSLLEAQNIFNKLLVRDLISYNALLAGYTEHGLVDKTFFCFEEMIHDGISPDYITFSLLLKACGRSGCIIKSRKLYIEIAKKGLENTLFVVHTLLEVYCKSGSPFEASKVINKLPSQITIMGNSLIIAYAKYGHSDETLVLLKQMETHGNVLDSGTLIWSLKACGSIGDATRGQDIHSEVTRRGLLEREELMGNSLIDMYANCGLLAEAQNIFTKLPVQDVFSGTALISGFVNNGCSEKALYYFEQMQCRNLSPSPFTFACGLKACGNIWAVDKGQKLHMEIVRTGFERDVFIGSSLIFMYAQCGLLSEAHGVLCELFVQDTVIWTILVSAYLEHGQYEQVLNIIEKMQQVSVPLCISTYIYGLKACGNICNLVRVQEMYIDLVKKGLEMDLSVGSTIVDVFSKCHALAEAEVLFDKLPVHNAASWISLLAGYVKTGNSVEALKHFEQMQQEGFSWCTDAYVHSLKACTDVGATLKGREIHAEIVWKGMERELLVGNTLINMYVKSGLLAEAQNLFDKLPGRDLVSWTTLISGYCEYGVSQEILGCFEQMQVEGVIPEELTFVCCLKACFTEEASMKGQALHSELLKKGLENECSIGSTLVIMYAKLGLLAEAHQVLDQLPAQKVESWNALITVYTENGCGEKGLECINQMQLKGICLDVGTLDCSLKFCGITGATTKIRELHAAIVQKGLDKETFIGNVLVGTYAKCGLLVDAQDVFIKLPVRDVSSWTAVITGFAQLGKCHNALFVFDRMLEEGKSPNLISFKAVLSACCHWGLVDKGLEYFRTFGNHFGLVPTLEHYTIMGDMLGRADQAENAVILIKRMPFHPNVVIWHTVLGVCKRLGNVKLGRHSFEQAVQLNENDNVAYFNMSNLYAFVSVEEGEPDTMQNVYQHSFRNYS